jgi:hypothetical protein
MIKQYSFLSEGWFSKSDEEIGRDNISKVTSRQFYEDSNMFLECYTNLFFILTALSDPYYGNIYDHVIKYHIKNKNANKNDLKFDDLDLPGQRIMQIAAALISCSENGVLDKVLEQFRKHLVRYEPREFKSLYLECTFDSIYDTIYGYLKDNKLNSLITSIQKDVDKLPIIQWLKEERDMARSYANNDGYNVKFNKIPNKAVMLPHNTTSTKSLIVKSNKIPKSLFNTIPKKKIRHLTK